MDLKKIIEKFGITQKNEEDMNPSAGELMKQISDTKRDMEQSRTNYGFADDDTLIDMYIYSMKAQEMKYKHLLQKLKKAL